MPDFRELSTLVRSRIPLITLETAEEPKALALLARIAREDGLELYRWTVADGLVHSNFSYGPKDGARLFETVAGRAGDSPRGQARELPDTGPLVAALHHIDKLAGRGLYVLLDPQPFLDDPVVVRLLREIVLDHPVRQRTLVLVAPTLPLPRELARHGARMRLRLPDLDALKAILRDEITLLEHAGGRRVRGEREAVSALLQQVVGMCEDDARRLLRNAIRDDGMITAADLERVMRYKREMLGEGAVEVETSTLGPSDVGGLARLKRWLAQRGPVFAGGRVVAGLPPPRGVLLLGVQGAGKSLAARVVAGTWRVPLLRLDFAALYDKYTGETERKLREALQAAEAMAPAVLWIDEIEKGLASDSDGDGGVSRRVLGTLLTWMAERSARVFLVATANDVSGLPPELMRKGRFDEIFFVDLPAESVRRDIFAIHLARRDLPLEGFDLDALARASDGFSGAEIEQLVISALYGALADDAALDTQRLLQEAGATQPLSVVMAEKIATLRAWASGRCVPAD